MSYDQKCTSLKNLEGFENILGILDLVIKDLLTLRPVFTSRKPQMFLSMASMYLPTLLSTTMLSGMPKSAKNTQKIWPAVELGLMFP